jgi:hypothetical protein
VPAEQIAIPKVVSSAACRLRLSPGQLLRSELGYRALDTWKVRTSKSSFVGQTVIDFLPWQPIRSRGK